MLRKSLYLSLAVGALATAAHAEEKRFDLADIHAIEAGSAFNIVVELGKTQSVVVEEKQGRFDNLEMEVDGGVLELGYKDHWHDKDGPDYIIKLTLKSLNEIDLSGASRILINGLKTKAFEIDTSGAAQIVINGSCEELDVDGSGATKLVAKDFQCKSVNLDLSGASTASIFASEKLKADVSGVSKLIVHGKAKDQHVETSGLSKVEVEG